MGYWPPSQASNRAIAANNGLLTAAYCYGDNDIDQSSIVLAQFDDNTLAARADPQFVPGATGKLFPDGLHCEADVCTVPAHESSAAVGPNRFGYGRWQVNLNNDEVIAPDKSGVAVGVATGAISMTNTAATALLGNSNYQPATQLSIWNLDGSLSQIPLLTDYTYQLASAFIENDTIRVFFKQKSAATDPTLQSLYENGQ